MTFKDKLIWLQGKKIAVCEPNQQRFIEIKGFLERYGIDVVALNSATAMRADLEERRYSTHRVFLAVFVNADLARDMEVAWREVTAMNPSLLKTPLILTLGSEPNHKSQDLIDAGYFRFCLSHPISANDMLRVLRRLNRWKAIRGDIHPAATLAK